VPGGDDRVARRNCTIDEVHKTGKAQWLCGIVGLQ
jgi:hypothetical protein